MESRGGKMVNLNNEIVKNQIKLITKDIEKEIKERPHEACNILNSYYGCGFVKMIFELVDSLE